MRNQLTHRLASYDFLLTLSLSTLQASLSVSVFELFKFLFICENFKNGFCLVFVAKFCLLMTLLIVLN